MSQSSPPSPEEFNTQVARLVKQLGASAFCALPGQLPEYTLFVEDGQVIAEPKYAPRHPYGVHCEISREMSEDQAADYVYRWLSTGAAYQEFLGMNVCRYNC